MFKLSEKNYFIISLLFFLILSSQSFAQKFGFHINNDRKSVTIPFEEYNNLVVIPVTINNTFTVKFIVDTGVQNAILTEKVLADLLKLEYKRKISISGPGLADSVTALISNNIKLSIPGGIVANNRSLLVLEEDYLQLKKQMGVEIYGIIGYELFSQFVVEFNYDKKEITFHNPETYKSKKRFRQLPLSIERTKPYIQTQLGLEQSDQYNNVKLMIDSGASHGLLLDPEEDELISIPDKFITAGLGKGLGGDIRGKVGRVQEIKLSDFTFKKVIASFPDPGVYNKNIKRGARSGTIGGELLSRLNPIYDYFNNTIYLRKSKNYRKSFDFDMSGLQISAVGPNLSLITIDDVMKDSPADRAGIKKGDIIKKLNGTPSGYLELSQVFTLLRKKDNLKIRLKIVRNGTLLKKCFRLKRLI